MIAGEWIRTELPRSWEVARLRDHATVVNGYPFDSELFSADTGLPLVRIRDIARLETEVRYAGEVVPEALLKGGEILVGMDGDFNVARWKGADALLNQRVCSVRPARTVDARFLYYVLPAPLALINEFTYSTTVKHLSSFDVLKIRIPFPPLSQQRAIADYLDRETARIDALIAAKERVLGLLAEKRRALITRAVTRGLDPHAPLRDSGLPWLGEIPEHWETWKIAHVASVGNGSTPNRDTSEYWTGGTIPWLNSAVVNQEEVTAADQFVTAAALRECHLPLVKPGSVLVGITGQGKTRGSAAVVSFAATINQHIAFITPKCGRLDSWFLRWTLFAAYEFLRSISDDAGGTKGALTCEEIAALRVALPPLDEQQAIVDHVSLKIGKLDTMRAATERTVALLRERRAALIAAAVTSGMGVRLPSPNESGSSPIDLNPQSASPVEGNA